MLNRPRAISMRIERVLDVPPELLIPAEESHVLNRSTADRPGRRAPRRRPPNGPIIDGFRPIVPKKESAAAPATNASERRADKKKKM